MSLDPKAFSSNLDWRLRNVEKSSALLACAQDRIIFQLPRGNLETINSRILLLETAAILSHAGKLSEAFLLLRKHKLSLGLLSDLEPEKFLLDITSGELFRQLKPKHLDLLILDLAEGCSPELKYVLTTEQIEERAHIFETNFGKKGKVEGLCMLVLKCLQEQFDFGRVKNEMVVFSKLVPPRYQQGLNRIKLLKAAGEREQNESQQDKLLDTKPHIKPNISKWKMPKTRPPHIKKTIYSVSGEPQAILSKDKIIPSNKHSRATAPSYKDALKYFCWLVDARQLYNSALASFDLDLAILVAEFTNMDPKEFLPYIESIRKMGDCVDSRVKICVDLKLFKKALLQIEKFLSQPTSKQSKTDQAMKQKWESAVVELIKEENLYAFGLELFWASSEISLHIKRALAKKLALDQNVKSAAEMWAQIGDFGEAFEAYAVVKDWKKALSCLEMGNTKGIMVQFPVNLKKFKKKKKKNKKQRRKDERNRRMRERQKKRKAKQAPTGKQQNTDIHMLYHFAN